LVKHWSVLLDGILEEKVVQLILRLGRESEVGDFGRNAGENCTAVDFVADEGNVLVSLQILHTLGVGRVGQLADQPHARDSIAMFI